MAILVTAGLTGIGLEICKQLENRNVEIIKTTSRVELVDKTSNCYYLNLAKPESIKELSIDLKKNNISISHIFHCAHKFSDSKLFLNITANDLREGLETNVIGTFEFLRIFLKTMTRKSFGRILIIGSNLAKKPGPGKLIYITEKNAIESMALAINSEVIDKDVKIKILHPSLVATKQVLDRISPLVVDHIGRENLLKPTSVAKEAIDFLMNESELESIKIYNGNQQW